MSSSSSSPAPTPGPSIFSEASSRLGSESIMTSSVPPTPEEKEETVEKVEDVRNQAKIIEELDAQERLKRLTYLLERSSTYAKILSSQMDVVKAKSMVSKTAVKKSPQTKKGRGRPPKRRKVASDGEDDANEEADNDKPAGTEERKFQQPAAVTGGKLKDYQLDGVAWMVGLYDNGISGILADEMGLGKTLQTIAFCAYLRERANSAILIVCPLSVLHNWIDEFKKFAPSIPVCMYHGHPDERAEMRKTVMRKIEDYNEEEEEEEDPSGEESQDEDEHAMSPNIRKRKSRRASNRKTKTSAKSTLSDSDDDKDYVEESEQDGDSSYTHSPRRKSSGKRPAPAQKRLPKQTPKTFPIVVTTYEIIIRDRKHLEKYQWGFIVVDEGHRLKNFNCKLVQEIKKYPSASRMILTGTPLHNNLGELWSLLNFILPDIFNDLNSFQAWFNVPEMQSGLDDSQSAQIITTLHNILKPFLLRRIKADVEFNLPPKKDYLLYAPLTEEQRRVYQVVLDGGIRKYLIEGIQDKDKKTMLEQSKKVNVDEGRKLRARGKKPTYDMEEDDDAYFKKLESGEFYEERRREEEEKMMELGEEYKKRKAITRVNNLHLLNAVIQLRKVCSHPFLFNWPTDPKTNSPIINDELVNASGKMLVLDRLLTELFKRGHKVLLFSQFTTMLDIIEDWATEFKGWSLCRIDGSTKPLDRREEMNRFQTGGDAPGAPHLFLLSTRAGGLGINLTAADTVIFYDQDWNPQMDIQAQDRAHRIGQTKPVLIFRLVSAHTIETHIMQRAMEKRKLETVVIAKDRFKAPTSLKGTGSESLADLAAALMKLEGEKIEVVPNTKEGKTNVLSDEDLDVLLDRSPDVFEGRGEGWAKGLDATVGGSGTGPKKAMVSKDGKRTKKGGAAFEVYVPAADVGNDALARMMDEGPEDAVASGA